MVQVNQTLVVEKLVHYQCLVDLNHELCSTILHDLAHSIVCPVCWALLADGFIDVDHDVVCPSKSFLPAVSVEDLCHLSMQGEMMLVHQLLVAEPVFLLDLQLGKTPRSVERPRLRWVLGPQCWPWKCCQTPSCPQGCRPRCSVLHLLPHGSCWSPQVWRTWWPSQSCWRSRRYCSPSCWSDKAAVNIICCQQNVDIIKKGLRDKNMLNSETVETLCSKSIMLSKTNMLPYTSTTM